MDDQRFYVITGASGAGKSTLVNALGELGYSVVPEIALTIVQEQERCGGNLFPWTDLQAFMEQVLVRNIQAHDSAQAMRPPVFFDRGLPECQAHMRLLGLEINNDLAVEAARRRYAGSVFVAEPWPEIYVCDRWRRAPFERAARSFEPTVAAYAEDGYHLRTIPKLSVRERLAFVLDAVNADT
ncbi:AAA family ATPase [Lysobacter sp. Root690]|uniref:AAA family ATPase n=1 Tax=Lysobacter sp. Root690 TaxID=1736588 RepID=UPI0006FF9825|nr:AAA family ATPase [Lysobacter sp. Root690]KRB07884.1 ATPase [Lysobacter sp. Root690]